jgi:ferrochelatase
VPWLEPDVNDRMTELAEEGVTGVVLVPIGFISDHMEVAFDLDTEAKETAAELGLDFTRVGTPSAPMTPSSRVSSTSSRSAPAQLRGEEVDAPAICPERRRWCPAAEPAASTAAAVASNAPTYPNWADRELRH